VTSPGLLVCAPLRVEALALRRGLPRGVVRCTGYGARSGHQVEALARKPAQALAVAGVGVAADDDLRPGDVVVATEVVGARPEDVVRCPSAPLVAHALWRRGCRVRTGRVRTVDRLVSAAEAGRLGADGTLAIDLESALLAPAARGRPLAVVRVVVDTPSRPLARADLPLRGAAALVRLGDVGAALKEWARAVRTLPEVTAPEVTVLRSLP
jgi:hypothetical protein